MQLMHLICEGNRKQITYLKICIIKKNSAFPVVIALLKGHLFFKR